MYRHLSVAMYLVLAGTVFGCSAEGGPGSIGSVAQAVVSYGSPPCTASQTRLNDGANGTGANTACIGGDGNPHTISMVNVPVPNAGFWQDGVLLSVYGGGESATIKDSGNTNCSTNVVTGNWVNPPGGLGCTWDTFIFN